MSLDFTAERAFVGDDSIGLDYFLWGVVLAAASADVALTLLGLSMCFSEANPVAQMALDTGGGAGLFVLKAAALGALFAVYRYASSRYRRAALVAFSLPQLFAVGHNTLLIVKHAHLC
ncbi:DUF5658 family protein [Haloarcula marina]|uniref:DUF5658 family protein n=1 Tax=Haloarcula marina TaxID=2961574 RepID=UPI0020B86FE0|nr:DUF5658 family protein [Halomicroarcula marina]